ncbi:MAG TPA: hypothetical protein VLB73_01780 [Patescibacteria group bacterium]|nr:hypothetical protein [Patescibacteria group bacterium]
MKYEMRLLQQVCMTSREKTTAITLVPLSRSNKEPIKMTPLFLEDTLTASTNGGMLHLKT